MCRRKQLERLINPQKIAVIGASDSKVKVGGLVFRQLLDSKRQLFPVNPKLKTILKHKVLPDVHSLPEQIDLAVIAIAASRTVEVVESCILKKIPNYIIVAGGFGEIGGRGREFEEALTCLARKHKLNILGPNSLGIFLPGENIDTIFVEHGDKALAQGGTIACIVQSGSFGTEAIGYASNAGYGMRAFIGLGNKCDLEEYDFLSFFGKDRKTNCLGFYLESIESGRKFIEAAGEVARKKPVVVLKAGATHTAASAACSHTGKLAGSDNVISGAFKQFGIQRVYDDIEFCDATKVLSMVGSVHGNRVAVLTAAGGYGVMCTDLIEKDDFRVPLKMAEISDNTRRQIKNATFTFASCDNPVDITASADDQMYSRCLDALIADKGIDIIICVAFFSPPGFSHNLVDIIAKKAAGTDKSIVVFTQYGPFTDDMIKKFYSAGVVAFPSLLRTIRAVRLLVERAGIEKGIPGVEKKKPQSKIDLTRHQRDLVKWYDGLDNPVKPDEYDAKALMRIYGIRTPEAQRFSPGEKPEIDNIPMPCVLKVCSSEIQHKTDHNGVVLNVERPGVKDAFSQMQKRFPGKDLLLENQIVFSEPEFILGLIFDSVMGDAIMVGSGGIFTELYNDTAFRLAPCSIADAMDMIDELTLAPVFRNFRAIELDKEKLANIISTLSSISNDFRSTLNQQITYLDINPIVWDGKNWTALDVKLGLEPFPTASA